jgi:hypothetical protein
MWGANQAGQNGAASATTQTVCGTSPTSWNVAADMQPAAYTVVQTYPCIQQLTFGWTGSGWSGAAAYVNNPTPVDSLASLAGSWSTVEPPSTDGDWELAYDIWTSTGKELMVWVDTSAERENSGANVVSVNGVEQDNVQIGGQSYTYENYGGNPTDPTTGLPLLILNSNEASGSVNLLAAFDYWESIGVIPKGETITEINFGWEICNTGGGTENFSLTGYTLTATP